MGVSVRKVREADFSHTGECLKRGILRIDLRFRDAESWRLDKYLRYRKKQQASCGTGIGDIHDG